MSKQAEANTVRRAQRAAQGPAPTKAQAAAKVAKKAKGLHPAIKAVTFTPATKTPVRPAGVAGGAAEQPHTKRAVMQARVSEAANAKAEGLSKARDVAGNVVYVDEADANVRTVDGQFVLFDAKTAKRFDELLVWEKGGRKGKAPAWFSHAGGAERPEAKLAEKAAGPEKAPKAAKPAKAKAEKKVREPKGPAEVRKITIVDKKFTYGADGSKRRACWDACKASKDTAEYAAKGGATKYLSRWEAAGAIKLG